MQLDAKVAVIEGGDQIAASRIMHRQRDVVANETRARDVPAGGAALESKQAFTRADMTASHLGSPSGKRLHHIDDGTVWHGIAQRFAIADLLAVDENRHVLAQFAVVFKNVATRPFIRSKICVQHFPERGARDVERRAFDMALDIAGEANG